MGPKVTKTEEEAGRAIKKVITFIEDQRVSESSIEFIFKIILFNTVQLFT
jgi:hypothetical protein